MIQRLLLAVGLFVPIAFAEPGGLWKGLRTGPYGAGFELRHTVDPTRNPDSNRPGTTMGIAIWYPASKPDPHSAFITQLEYHLLEYSKPLDFADQKAYLDEQAREMVAWRHIGIVPLTQKQALMTFSTSGRAVRNASHAKGKFPVVIILGGPWYLSTTAEFLASHGYFVVAPIHFQDARTEVPNSDFRWSIENSLRDAEWALAELCGDPAADLSSVTSLGHGGGGLQAMLLAMRNRQITAVANIDAGIFSSHTNPRQLPLYDPRLMRVPYLYVLTADTRRQSDQFSDFQKMRFSRRYEIVLQNPALRHHDLSNVGRAVSSALGIRGDPEPMVLKTFADVQNTLLNFIDANQHRTNVGLAQWLQHLSENADYAVTTQEATQPAPELYDVLAAMEQWTPDRLREAHQRDPDAEIFSEEDLLQILAAARLHDLRMAQNLVPIMLEVQPQSIQLLQLASAIAEASGDTVAARELTGRCLAISIPEEDWRAQTAHKDCRERLVRSVR